MKKYDVIIIGAGPAGLTCALYTSRSNLKTLIIENDIPGGKLSKTYEVENYPGISSINGAELAMKMQNHALSFGAEMITSQITKVDTDKKKVILSDNEELYAEAIVFATGTKERKLALPYSDEFTGRGISYCAVCDGFFYRKKDVVVIGGGNSALEEALYLANIVNSITIIIRRDVFRAEPGIVGKVKENPKIKIITKSVPDELVIENDTITGLRIRNTETDEKTIINCSGIFPYIGADPENSLIPDICLNEYGYVKVDTNMETTVKGIYAAGDITDKTLRQIVTACSDGAVAANAIKKSLDSK